MTDQGDLFDVPEASARGRPGRGLHGRRRDPVGRRHRSRGRALLGFDPGGRCAGRRAGRGRRQRGVRIGSDGRRPVRRHPQRRGRGRHLVRPRRGRRRAADGGRRLRGARRPQLAGADIGRGGSRSRPARSERGRTRRARGVPHRDRAGGGRAGQPDDRQGGVRDRGRTRRPGRTGGAVRRHGEASPAAGDRGRPGDGRAHDRRRVLPRGSGDPRDVRARRDRDVPLVHRGAPGAPQGLHHARSASP